MSGPDSPGVELSTDGAVGRMRIVRPDRMNAFTREVLTALTEAIGTFEDDPSVRAILLSGEGDDAFCSGVDMDEMQGDPVGSEAELVDVVRGAQGLLRRLRGSELPIVAAVNGHAIGAGMDIALGCDFRIVKAEATLSQAYVNVGLVPGDGGAYMLPRMIGETKAKELILTGKRISGREAGELGIATEVVAGDASATVESASSLASDLAAGPTVSIGCAKRMVNDSFDLDFEAALDQALEFERVCHGTEDHVEAITAFRDGREPEFGGE